MRSALDKDGIRNIMAFPQFGRTLLRAHLYYSGLGPGQEFRPPSKLQANEYLKLASRLAERGERWKTSALSYSPEKRLAK